MARSLVFDIFAIDRASHVFRHVGDEAEHMGAKFGIVGKALGAGVVGLAAAAAGATAVGFEALKTAGDMETRMNRLVSTAGESAAGVKSVWSGIDKLAAEVGTSVIKLADAMYYVEGAGFHGADALRVLTAVSKGAKVEMADTTEVAKAIGGALADYNMKASQAATTTNAFLTAVGHGQTSFNDFAEAFPKVGSRAAAANVTLNETLSALSRMTRDGLPANMAATYLGQTIGHLAYPTAAAAATMEGLGINVLGVQKAITSGDGHGLGDAIQMLYTGIQKHLTPAGLVAIDIFKKSKGSVSDFQKVLANIPPEMQTQVGALAAMSGGVKGFQGILMLGNDHLKGYKDTLAAVNATTKKGGDTIEGVARQQESLNGLWADTKGALSGFADSMGRWLLPYAKEFLAWLNKSLPSIESWVATVAEKAIPVVKRFGTWIKNDLWPALKEGYQTILPGVKQAWAIVTGGTDGAHVSWKQVGDTITKVVIPAAAHFMRYELPALAVLIRVQIETIKKWWQEFQTFISIVKPIFTMVLRLFANLSTAVSAFFAALGTVPGFGWAKDAATAMLGAATQANALANALNTITPPPPINIPIGVYGTSAIADALIAGNAPLANSMISANHYDSGAAYRPPVSHSVGNTGRYNAGQRASGGPVRAGMTYRVGEEGPENVTFGADGYVSNARASKAGSKGALVNIENYHEGSKSVQQIAAELMFRARFA